MNISVLSNAVSPRQTESSSFGAHMEQIPEKHGSDLLSMVSAHRRSIMGVAAVLIYIFHKHSQIFPGGFLATLELCGKKILFLGVDIFMLISGLGLTYAIRKHKLFPFWLRRLKRIVLPFLLTGAVVAVIEHWDAATLIGNLSGYNFYAKNIYSFCGSFRRSQHCICCFRCTTRCCGYQNL
jgi:hypothetical protein